VKLNLLPAIADRAALLVALVAGACTVFAFAPFGWWPLQIATLALVFWLVLRQGAVRRAGLIGWAYGFGWSVCGVYWLYISMHTYGAMPAWMAALAVGLMGLVLGAFSALAMSAGWWLAQRWAASASTALLIVFPAAWMLSEWLRGWVLTGLPWVVSGYAHTAGPLAGFAPVVGVYGIGWLAAVIAGCVALLLTFKRLPLVLAIAILGTGAGLKTMGWTAPSGQPISVRLIQGNVPQEMKFASDQIHATLALYHDMIRAAPADLIATPETAMPLLSHQLPPDYLGLLLDFSRLSNSHIALGIAISDGPRQYANSVLGLAPSGTKPYRYDKHHLVPFGEFIPTGARWFVNMMRIPLGDFTRGPVLQAPFAVKDQLVLPNICYEDLFGEEIADQLAASYFSGMRPATMLLNVSNIAWFGDSVALPQHLQISQMRALETRRPMLRATNTGTTAIINPKGEVVAQLPPFTRGTLAAAVQGYSGATPYILLGNTLVVGLALLTLGLAWLSTRKRRMKSPLPIETR
jgi:apolipoprotein N-acyltransferase